MSDFWTGKLAPQQLPEQAPTSLRQQYRDFQAAKTAGGSGSQMYSLPMLPEQRARSRPSLYSGDPGYQGLQQYGTAKVSKWAKRADESGDAYLARTGAILRAIDTLPEAEQRLITETREAIINAEPQSVQAAHDDLRKVIDQRQSANGVRGQGHKVSADERFGTPSRVERQGGMPAPAPLSGAKTPSIVEISAKLRQAEAERLQAIPQRVSTAHLRPTGEGLITR
jgi:hypothetical protein